MSFSKFNIQIITRIILITALSLSGSIYFSKHGLDIITAAHIIILIIIPIRLISFIKKTNEEISFFFSAIRNDDSSLVFNEDTGSRSYNNLHKSINAFNLQLQGAKMDIIIQEKFFKAVVENTPSAIMAYDNDGNIHLANSAIKILFGISNLHNINQFQRVNDKLIKILKDIRPGEPLMINMLINGSSLHLSLNAVCLKLKAHDIKVVAIQDISQELDRQEIESWQKLIRILNHEIMNSVAPITSLSSTISGFYKDSGIQKESSQISNKTITDTLKGLSVIENHGKGLISFIESYRSLSKLPIPHIEEVMVSNIFERVNLLAVSLMSQYEYDKNSKPRIKSVVNPDNLSFNVDEELIIRVLFNLVKNSIEALSGHSDPHISLEAGQHRNGHVWLKISDNGTGMDEDVMSRIFVPFFTTKDSGNGIGLSLSKQIINMHKGNITVQSAPGEGTTMNILF